jgi:sulfatase maturation enzyme AslB (radical SAM superfamily)
MFTKDTFCILPWSSILIEPAGDFKLCCFSGSDGRDRGMAKGATGEILNVLTHSIGEAMNSELHKSVRLAQSKNERHPSCKVCWVRDDANKANLRSNSLRTVRSFNQLNTIENAITLDNVQEYLAEDGSLDHAPISLDLRFSNVCNMKCIMCSSVYSNQWYEDEIKLTGSNLVKVDSKTYTIYKENDVYRTDMQKWHDSDAWWDSFEKIKHRVRHIYMTGGEPFIVKGHDVLLDKLIDCGNAKNVVMEYDTNLSVINTKILDRLEKFKEVILSVSCDDVEDRYELIRFPGKFQRILDNLEKLKARSVKVRHLSSCVGIYSLYSPIRLYEYFEPLGYVFSFRFLRFPDHSAIAYLPKELKKQVMETYSKSTLPDKWKIYMLSHLLENIEMPEDKCVAKTKEHIKYLNSLDEIRGTDWKATFPEIADLLKDYI